GVKERGVKRTPDARCQVSILAGFRFLAGETGRQRHDLGVAIVVSRRSNVRRGGGLIRRPIVQPEADDAILGFGGEVIYIAFESRVMLAQNPGVAAILI